MLLIVAQRPTATRCAGFQTWKKLGRYVRRGEKGILILAPCVRKFEAERKTDSGELETITGQKLVGFRAAYVFDVAQTDGKELPELSTIRGSCAGYILSTFFAILKAARKWGYQAGEIKRADLVIPNDRPSKPGRFFLPEEVDAILALAEEPWKTVFSVAAMTGLRPGEVLGLSIDDLDFQNRQVFVRRSAWYGRLQAPKSKSSVAPVPMPDKLATILAKFLETWTPNEERLLFVNRAGRPHSANKVVQRKLWPILDTLGIPRCGMHAFRHSLGTALGSIGASVKTIQTQLRHASSAVTMEKYVHSISRDQREDVEKAVAFLRSDVANSETNASLIN